LIHPLRTSSTLSYFILGSAIEVALLAGVVYFAWTWPKVAPATTAPGRAAPAHHVPQTAPSTA